MTEAVAKELPAELDSVTLQKAYARWAPVYDLVFGAVFDRGRRAAIDAAARLDSDWLSRGMSDPKSLLANARRYRELKGKEITWPLPA